MFVCMHVCIFVGMYEHTYVCVYVCVCLFVCVCVCVCVCVYVCGIAWHSVIAYVQNEDASEIVEKLDRSRRCLRELLVARCETLCIPPKVKYADKDRHTSEKAMMQHNVIKRKPKKPRQDVVSSRRQHQEHRVGSRKRSQPTVNRIARAEEQRSHVGQHVPEKSLLSQIRLRLTLIKRSMNVTK